MFFRPAKAQVIICQVQRGSLGINLARASHCFFYSHTFSLGDYVQARKRIHGHDQKAKKCIYYHLVAARSVDELIIKALAKRARVIDHVVDELRKEKVQCQASRSKQRK